MDWPTVTLSEVAEINPRLPKEMRLQSEMDVAFLQMASVSEQGGILDVELRKLEDVVKGFTYFAQGDVIVAKITPCMENGKAAYIDHQIPTEIGFGSTEFHVIRPGPKLDGKYLFHLIWSDKFRFIAEKNMTGTAGQKRVPTSFIQRYKFALPPLDEQRRIAAILDKADEINQTTEKSDELKVEMIRSTYLEMFGDPALNPNNWQKEKLGDISNSILGKMLSPDARNMQPQYSYLANRNVRWRTFSLEDLESMHFNDKELQKYSLETGDVLICEGGEVGRCAVWRDEISNCYFQKALHRLRCNRDYLEPEFFVETMMLLSSQGALFASTSTATFSHLTGVRLKQLMIPIPPIDLQKKFVRILEQISAIPSSSEISIQNTSSIVQQLLN